MRKSSILMRRHRSYTRLPRSTTFRILLLLLLIWDTLHCVSLYTRQIVALDAPPPPKNTKRIYIAAQHWNDARLLRQHWNAALVALVQELDIENVFVIKGRLPNDPDVKNIDYDDSNVKKAQKSFDEAFPSNVAFQSDDCRIHLMIPPLFTDTRNNNYLQPIKSTKDSTLQVILHSTWLQAVAITATNPNILLQSTV